MLPLLLLLRCLSLECEDLRRRQYLRPYTHDQHSRGEPLHRARVRISRWAPVHRLFFRSPCSYKSPRYAYGTMCVIPVSTRTNRAYPSFFMKTLRHPVSVALPAISSHRPTQVLHVPCLDDAVLQTIRIVFSFVSIQTLNGVSIVRLLLPSTTQLLYFVLNRKRSKLRKLRRDVLL